MNLLNIIKNNLFIQNIVASIISIIPPYLEFSVGKYFAIKKALYITAHDKLEGCYLEFGVFTGSSFNLAMKANKKIDKLLGCSNCEFVGFDSFEGFGTIKKEDEHPMFNNNTFSVNEKKVFKNIKKNSAGQTFQLIKGFYEKTLKHKSPADYNIKKARVVMIDCDLKESTSMALNFVRDVLQIGTIIMFDDYIFYKGDEQKGEYSAFKEFKKSNPDIKFRKAFEYGYGSRAFIVSKI